MKSSTMGTALLLLLAVEAGAQAPPDSTAGGASGVAAVRPDTLAAPRAAAWRRASWLQDGTPLGVGDLLTVVVDEQTAANERVSQVATGDRAIKAGMNIPINEDLRVGPSKTFQSGLASNSRDVGEAGRSGGFTAVLSVRVVALEPNGLARIEGHRQVNVDGRLQDIALTGTIRPQDVGPSNRILSSRIADAVITYKGKKIGPRTGIMGRILGMLWP